jgi:hypothetical protein
MGSLTIDTGKVQARLLLPPAPGCVGLVEIATGRKVATYGICEIETCEPSPTRAFRLLEQGSAEEPYDLEVGGGHRSCECKGFLRWGHCKHVDSVQSLITSGAL